ncbi:MAG: SH3 domain-containing protein [Chloroflexota bacterium]
MSKLVAQDTLVIQYGSASVNNLPTADSSVIYSFDATIGDLVTIRAVGTSPGSDPRLSLAGPSQNLLATNDNTLSFSATTTAEIVFRIQETGKHFIVVNGTPGDFLLTLDSRPAVPLTVLQFDTPLSINFPLADPSQAYVFNTDPVYPTTLFIEAVPFSLDAYVELRDGTGEIISTLRSNLNSSCISIGAGDQLLELTIVAAPEVTGTVNLTLTNVPCALGVAPAQPPPTFTPQFTPSVVEGVCVASSPRNINLRSGPGTNYARLALLPARQTIQVIGQSDNGQWLVVQNDVLQGWVSALVVSVTGPCAQLPVVAAPPVPVASATPGFPVIIVQPVVTATPGVIVITATPVVLVTPPITLPPPPAATVTPQPTVPVPTAIPPTVAAPTATVTLTITATP